MVQFSADLSLTLYSPMFWALLTPKHVHLLSVVFFQFHPEERWGMHVQIRLDISRMVEDKDYVTIVFICSYVIVRSRT